ncbi:hypothetical protein AVEN_270563-1 [Araneus ventricosus]|uniref:Uncharacterized protein n=1 Tax=Araneus ventricosus TaxID=182803 RepID=A0A4Y2B7A0_ARAVE|nr:hypothetical protein AVEN_270563-1 [Araneus ventricosus]
MPRPGNPLLQPADDRLQWDAIYSAAPTRSRASLGAPPYFAGFRFARKDSEALLSLLQIGNGVRLKVLLCLLIPRERKRKWFMVKKMRRFSG